VLVGEFDRDRVGPLGQGIGFTRRPPAAVEGEALAGAHEGREGIVPGIADEIGDRLVEGARLGPPSLCGSPPCERRKARPKVTASKESCVIVDRRARLKVGKARHLAVVCRGRASGTIAAVAAPPAKNRQ
jgi:hypothetical protein